MAGLRTFVDADVLISAFRGSDPLANHARAVLDDCSREFVASDILRLEVVPKAHYNQVILEEQFYDAYWNSLADCIETEATLAHELKGEPDADRP